MVKAGKHPRELTLSKWATSLSTAISATESWLWKMHKRPTSTKLWNKWERTESSILKFTLGWRRILWRSRRPIFNQDHSQLSLIKLSTQSRPLKRTCFTRLQTNLTDQRCLSNKTCLRNTALDLKHSLTLSTEAVTLTLDWTRSRPPADSTTPWTSEYKNCYQYFTF